MTQSQEAGSRYRAEALQEIRCGDQHAPRRRPVQHRIGAGGTVSSLTASTTAAVSSSGPIWARPLQYWRCRSFELLEFPAVYQPLPVSIPRGRRGNRIAVIGAARISRRWPLRRDSSRRGNLRLDGADDGDHRDDGQRNAHPECLIRVPSHDWFACPTTGALCRLAFASVTPHIQRYAAESSPEEFATIAALLRDTIAADRYPLSPRIRSLPAA
jgi:hypothetical protein